MEKVLICFFIFISAIDVTAQQADSTGIYDGKRDSLAAAGVTAQRNLVRMDADKLTYDVENDIDSKSMTVLEMLRKIPMVSVGEGDKITVNGSSSFKVYVDGHPDQILSTRPSEMFRVMPASNIKSIEVVTSPGAKYDAEGVGGVLEIKTISGSSRILSKGIYGNLMMDINSLGNLYGSATVNASFDRWTFGASIQPSHYIDVGIEKNSHRETAASLAEQSSIEDIVNDSYTGTFDASYALDSLDLVTASISLNHSPNHGRMYDGHYSATEGTAGLYSYDMSADYHESWEYVMGGIDWQHRFRSDKERILTLSWQFTDNPSRSRDTTFIGGIQGDLPFESDNVILIKDNKSIENTVQVDLCSPIDSNQSVISGGKLIFRGFRTDATDGINPVDYDYYSNIGAVYAEYMGRFGCFTFKCGLRYEHTWQEYSAPESFSLDYGNLVPDASIQYSIGKWSSVSLSYNLRISRPGISYLSPYVNRSEPNSISYGNPELKAENSHRFNLSYNLSTSKWIVSVRVGEYFSSNGISRYTFLNRDISESTYGNIVSRNIAGANVNVSWNASGKTRVFLSTDGAYQMFWSEVLDHSNHGVGVSAYFGVQQVLPWDIRLSSILIMETRSYSLQGWSRDPDYLSLRLSKSCMEDRLNFTLSGVTNFTRGGAEMKSYTEGNDFAVKEIAVVPWRYVGMSISYTFGNRQISVKHTSRSIVNDDLVGGGNPSSVRSQE